jgi:hypothetical protein
MKNFLITITALLAITFTFFFTGCKKEDTINSELSEQKICKGFGDSSSINPYNKNHEYLDRMLQEVTEFLLHLDENYENDKDYEQFMRDFEGLMFKYKKNYPYPEFDINAYKSEKQQVISNLIENYVENIGKVGLTAAIVQTERDISLLSDRDLQNNMFSLVSQLSFTFSMINNMEDIFYKPNWGERFKNCMYKKAEAYENGNWIEHVGCIPWCPYQWAASCAWDATFNTHLHHNPY